jgi:cbb3-type cytochrome oxidase subunit 3
MQDLLIIFIVLLLLLILISTLGGSIHKKEHFDEIEYEQFLEEEEEEDELVKEEFKGARSPRRKPVPVTKPSIERKRGKEHFDEEKEGDELPPAEEHFTSNEEDLVEGFDGDQWALYK